MKDLASLQRSFQRHLDTPTGAMERAVFPAPRASAARRLGVYADAYRLRLVEALGNDYPGLKGLLGERQFDRAMRAFIDARPSRFANLRWYGGELARHLARSPHWGRRPLLADLARFEWALGLAFDSADVPLATAEQVSRVPAADWPAMRLQLHPSVQRLWLRSAAPRAWSRIVLGRDAAAAGSRQQHSAWLVWRRGHAPFFRVLPPGEAWALGAAARGRDFASLAGGLRRFVGAAAAAQTAAQLLRNWLNEGLIVAIE